MKDNHYKIGLILILYCFAANINAADIAEGKAKSAICQGCHGSEGLSSNPLWPNLAGQSSQYIEAQLNNFKSGVRDNLIMKTSAQVLSAADIQNIAAYFASLPAKSTHLESSQLKEGKEKLIMCMGCHGEHLQGRGQIPRLAAQNAQYIVKQLHDFKNGQRKGGAMNAIAKNLVEEDIKTLAAYIEAFTN